SGCHHTRPTSMYTLSLHDALPIYPARNLSSTWAADNRDIWYEGDAYRDRLRLRTEGRVRRADGAPLPPGPLDPAARNAEHYDLRSEEHTSELQSRENLVCRLLLEK